MGIAEARSRDTPRQTRAGRLARAQGRVEERFKKGCDIARDRHPKVPPVSNDLQLVQRAVTLLKEHGVDVWLAGGWAEELHGMQAPRNHHDIDLLYPADNFGRVDTFLRNGRVEEITAKRFPHKRAFELDGVMVELFLVQPGPLTRFWSQHDYHWPADTFEDMGDPLRLASTTALIRYRTHRPPKPDPGLHTSP